MKLISVDKLVDYKFLKMYKLNLVNRKNNPKEYLVASRRDEKDLACKNRNHEKVDAVMIVPITREREFILLKQFRPAINDFIYEFPAGLVDQGEDILKAAKRELFEETGLSVVNSEILLKPSYTSVGMSDETVAVVKALVEGEISTDNAEDDEEIEVLKIKESEIKEFIKENNVSIKTALAILSI